MLLNIGEVQALLKSEGLDASKFRFSDKMSHTVTAADVYRIFDALYASLPLQLRSIKHFDEWEKKRVPKYISEVYDCDNHAYEMMIYAARVNAVTALEKPYRKDGGILVGVVMYHALTNGRLGPHAANIFIDHQKRIKFFEPGDGKVINLIEQEIASIWHGRFI